MKSLTLRLLVAQVVVALILPGCVGLDKTRKLTTVGGYLHSPDGKQSFKKGNKELLSRISGESLAVSRQEIYAEDSSVLVRIEPFGHRFLSIYSLDEKKDVEVDHTNSSYQIDDALKVPFVGVDYRILSSRKNARVSVDSEIAYAVTFGRNLYEWTFPSLEVGKQVKYRIPFTIGKEEYLIDVATVFRNSYSPEILLWGPSSP